MRGETLVESLQAVDTQSGLCLIISFITYGIVWRSEVSPFHLAKGSPDGAWVIRLHSHAW